MNNIEKPGRAENLITPSEALRRNPDFFSSRPEGVSWTLRMRNLDGSVMELPAGTDWEVTSRFGAVRSAVVTNPDGSPAFDRPRYEESPNVNIVAWGKDTKGNIRIGMISQQRPHADNVFEPESTDPMSFSQIPMGFLEKVIGSDHFESVKAGAARETTEETGAAVIKTISYPELPEQYPNPTFIGTTSNVAFVEVDLQQIERLKIDRTEGIFHAEYLPLDTVLADIRAGKNEHGYTRMATSNAALLLFLSGLRSIQHARRNEARVQAESEANKVFKAEDPEGYIRHSVRRAVALHGGKYEDVAAYKTMLDARANRYLTNRENAATSDTLNTGVMHEVFVPERKKRKQLSLTETARQINTFAGTLSDDVLFRDLVFPSKEMDTNVFYQWQDLVATLPPSAKNHLSRFLSVLVRDKVYAHGEMTTVGDIRAAHPRYLKEIAGLAWSSAHFLKEAFAKHEPEQPLQ